MRGMIYSGFRKFLALLLMASLFVLGGCKSYEFFSINIFEPAKENIPPQFDKVVITYNTPDNRQIGVPYIVYEEKIVDTTRIDTLLDRTAVYNLAEMLNIAGKYETVLVDSIQKPYPAESDDFTQQDVYRLRSLCDKYDANACILLSDIRKYVTYDTYYNNFDLYGALVAYVNMHWLFIDPYRTKLLDGFTTKDTTVFYTENPFPGRGPEKFVLSNSLMQEAAVQSAISYGSRISPHLVESPRMIFKNGNREIKHGYKQALKGNWKNAAQFWRDALSDPAMKNKAKAGFNLALASEMEGLLEPALQWAQESYRFFPDSVNKTYIDILKERIAQQEKIDRQMGFEEKERQPEDQ